MSSSKQRGLVGYPVPGSALVVQVTDGTAHVNSVGVWGKPSENCVHFVIDTPHKHVVFHAVGGGSALEFILTEDELKPAEFFTDDMTRVTLSVPEFGEHVRHYFQPTKWGVTGVIVRIPGNDEEDDENRDAWLDVPPPDQPLVELPNTVAQLGLHYAKFGRRPEFWLYVFNGDHVDFNRDGVLRFDPAEGWAGVRVAQQRAAELLQCSRDDIAIGWEITSQLPPDGKG
jgi:hypothetical protein